MEVLVSGTEPIEVEVLRFCRCFEEAAKKRAKRWKKDPLAQSFTVDGTGMNLTSVDLFFGTKDPVEKLTVEVRPMELGTPTGTPVDAFSQVVLSPDEINVSI